MVKNYFDRLQHIDHLIRIKGTGCPKTFARKLSISESTLYEFLQFMKLMGAPIMYCRARETYYYSEAGAFNLYFQPLNRSN